VSIRKFFARDRWDAERARELESYLAIETDENIARGLSPDDARAAARRKLGNATVVREEIYHMNSIGFVDSAWRDLRFGLRLLRLNPGFAIVAILSLALGIGANAAMFQLLDAIRVQTLPVQHPEELALIRLTGDVKDKEGGFNGSDPELTNVLWERLRDRQQAFSSMFVWGNTSFQLSSGGESRVAEGLWVSGRFFETLHVAPLAGRLMTDADDRRGCSAPPAVISDAFWQREYGGRPSAIGATLTLDRHPYTIVGVTPPAFFGAEVGRTFDVAVPLCAEALSRGSRSSLDQKDSWFLAAMGRLKPGWSLARATAHLDALSPALFRETLPNYGPEAERAYLGFRLGAFRGDTGISELRESYESPLWLLLAITALVLLITCANLANLMLARATAREREIAVRLSLGASRPRIIRQLIAESALIAAIGAAAGAIVAAWLSQALVASLTTESDRVFMDVSGGSHAVLFLSIVAAAACVLFGVVPAIRATAIAPGAAMKGGNRLVTDSRQGDLLRRTLVVGQIALCLVLMVAALLFVRSFRTLMTLDAGFSRQDVLVARTDFSAVDPAGARVPEISRRLLDALRAVPGVTEAAQVRNVPIGGSFSNRNIFIDGVRQKENVNYNSVSDRYFAATGAQLLAGRDFNAGDSASEPKVAIVTESFARKFFGGSNPIGRVFQIDGRPGQPRPPYQIVGLARDAKYGDVRETFAPLIYVPVAQDDMPSPYARFVVRSSLPTTAIVPPVTGAIRSVHPSIVVGLRTIASQINDSLVRERLLATLSALFGALATLIAVIGLYGVMSYSVERRRNEIGIRLALGAEPTSVISMVMREALLLLAIGLGIGAGLAVASGRAASTLVFGLTPHDPLTLTMAAAALGVTALLASYIPARRASRLEPTEALREA